MAQFLLLLHHAPDAFSGKTPEELSQMVAKYRAFGERLVAEGSFVSSHKLKENGGRSILREQDRTLVTDGPFAEAKEVLGGYFLIRATSYDAAVDIARACPHLDFHGRIELREVDLLE